MNESSKIDARGGNVARGRTRIPWAVLKYSKMNPGRTYGSWSVAHRFRGWSGAGTASCAPGTLVFDVAEGSTGDFGHLIERMSCLISKLEHQRGRIAAAQKRQRRENSRESPIAILERMDRQKRHASSQAPIPLGGACSRARSIASSPAVDDVTTGSSSKRAQTLRQKRKSAASEGDR